MPSHPKLVIYGALTLTLSAAAPAFAQATIISTQRSVEAFARVYDDFGHDESLLDREETALTGLFSEQVSATTGGLGGPGEPYTSEADLHSTVSDSFITASAFVNGDGGYNSGLYGQYADATVSMNILFTIDVPNNFALNISWTGDAYRGISGEIGSVTFLLSSATETIASAANFEYLPNDGGIKIIENGAYTMNGVLAPGDYTLEATVRSDLGIIPASESTLQHAPGWLDFSLIMLEIPTPSTLLTLAAPAAFLARRRRR